MKNLTIEITDICPLACPHCSTYGSWDREDILISIGKFAGILEENPDFKEIRLSGGEPFMHPGIVRLAGEAKFRDRIVKILTSGVYRKENDYQPVPEKIIQRCSGLVDQIQFSLHGSAETHEKVVGVPGIFQHVDKTVNRAICAEIPFSFGFVPIRTNSHDLEGAVKYASEKARQQKYCNPELHLLRYVKQGGSQYDIENLVEKLALTPEENQKIIEQAKILGKKYEIPVIATCSMLEKGCTAGREKKAITISGEICDCSALKWGWKSQKSHSRGQCACKERH